MNLADNLETAAELVESAVNDLDDAETYLPPKMAREVRDLKDQLRGVVDALDDRIRARAR